MPVVRVDIPHGHSNDTKAALKEAIRDAIITTIDPKITKYIYIAIRDAYAEFGDGAPLITVDLRPGRETERKAALAESLSKAFTEALGNRPEDLYLLFRETPASQHYCGGQPLPDWQP
jgi:phenylpyruvate tautomerase PptA (4-oxalocrotonate tautomerase family)